MDVEVFCTKCDYIRKTLLESNKSSIPSFPFKIQSITSKLSCPECRLIFKSYTLRNFKQNKNNADSSIDLNEDESEFFTLPNKSFYFHLNNQELFEKKLNRNVCLNGDGDSGGGGGGGCDLNASDSLSKKSYSDMNVLLVNSGLIQQLPFVKCLKTLSFARLICLCRSRTWAFDYFDDWILAEHENIEEKEASLNAVKEYTKKRGIKLNAVIAYEDSSIRMASFIANNLNLPSIPYDVISKCKNKAEFRKYCYSLGINSPKFAIVASTQRLELLKKLNKLNNNNNNNNIIINSCFDLKFPVIVKNTYGVGKGKLEKMWRE
jgi:hypothetical protein